MITSGLVCRDLIGRSLELAYLLARTRPGPARRSAVVVVRGEAGVGKSRLAEEFVAATRRAGTRAVTVAAREYSDAPYAPISEASRRSACARTPSRRRSRRRAATPSCAASRSSPRSSAASAAASRTARLRGRGRALGRRRNDRGAALPGPPAGRRAGPDRRDLPARGRRSRLGARARDRRARARGRRAHDARTARSRRDRQAAAHRAARRGPAPGRRRAEPRFASSPTGGRCSPRSCCAACSSASRAKAPSGPWCRPASARRCASASPRSPRTIATCCSTRRSSDAVSRPGS